MKPEDEKELLQRTKRIETRLTQFMIAQGVTTEHKRPVVEPGNPTRVVVPSRHTTLSEIMAVIPAGGGPVDIMIGDDWLARMALAS